MKAIILCGEGEEGLAPLTLERPLPLLSLFDKPLLAHQAGLLRRHGVREIGVALPRLSRMVEDAMGDGEELGVRFTWLPCRGAGELELLAACAGLDWLAISDHDTNRSVRYAYAHPEQNGVKLIPAVELTAYDYGREHRVHILCYYPDDCEALARHTAVMNKRRYDAVYQSCKELEEICPQFKTEEALEFAKDSGTLYKAHVMRVLWQYGLSDGMYNTVYRSLFGLRPVRGKILHTPVYETVDTILNLIQECRGVAVLAHPSVYHSMPLARELIAAGRLDGVEIDHPRNTEEDKAELEQLAAEYGLIVTGGTDYHGMNTNTPHPVGTCTTADEQIARIRALAEARKK